MTPKAAWRLLGIEPAADSKAIRRAYAAKLRAINPDEDHEGFARLREARDVALRLAAQAADAIAPVEEEAAQPVQSDGIEKLLPCPSLPLTAPAAMRPEDCATEPAAFFPVNLPESEAAWQAGPLAADHRAPGEERDEAGGETIDLSLPDWPTSVLLSTVVNVQDGGARRADHALYDLLYPDPEAPSQDRAMTAEEAEAGIALIDQLHGEAQQGVIDLHARIENWLSEILAGAWPRSHALLPHAADLFGWAAQDGQIDAPPAIDYINRRLAADRFAEAVRHKDHPLNAAWRQLTKSTRPGQTRALWWQGAKIDELLATIRRDHPEVEGRLNWDRVAMWDTRSAKSVPWWGIAFCIWGIFQIIVQVGNGFGHRSSGLSQDQVRVAAGPSVPGDWSAGVGDQSQGEPPLIVAPRVPGGLGDIDADMKAAVLAALGPDVTVERLKSQAPSVFQLFDSNWRIGIDSGRTQADYVQIMIDVIRTRYVTLARNAGGEHLIALQRQRLAEERQLKGEHWKECAEVGREGGLAKAALIPADVRDSGRDRIAALVLGAAYAAAPPRAPTFMIPGAIVERTVEQSGLTLDQVSAAFQGKGSDREQCLTHIALLDAMLEADAKTRAALITNI